MKPYRALGPAGGLTLVEILITLSIVAIIALLAAPSMQEMLARQRVQSIASEVMTDIHMARSEAAQRSRPVRIVFASNSSMSCYTIHTTGVVGTCNCTRPQGQACLDSNGAPQAAITEIKTVQVQATTTVNVRSAPNASITFDLPQLLPNRNAFRVDVTSSRSGSLRVATNMTGRPSMCSPDGSITGVPRCE